MALKRVNVDGKVLNTRTADMLERLEFNVLKDLWLTQGSYNKGGVSQSAGTHDGGGAVDLSVNGLTPAEKKQVVLEGRRIGFAMWHRTTSQGPWIEHIHGIAIDDPELSSGASSQVSGYRRGENGLANRGKDDGPRLRKIPVWPNVALKKVNLLTVRRQFGAKNPESRVAVKRVQWVLNKKVNAGLKVDGVAGAATRKAFAKWQKEIKAKKTDGKPGIRSLRLLGKGWFSVNVASFKNK